MIKVTHDRKSRQILIDIGRHPGRHRRGLKLALNEIGSEVVNKMANFIFNGPKTGRLYQFRGSVHQASAPGESPANRTSNLARSGKYTVRSHLEMTVGETAEYAGYLESGTRKMKPRPHLVRAVNANHRNTVKSIQDHIDRELKQ